MTTFLAGVTHDLRSNTLEATWLAEVLDAAGVLISYQSVKCTNYSQPQKAQFLSDLNTYATPVDGTKYCVMAGW